MIYPRSRPPSLLGLSKQRRNRRGHLRLVSLSKVDADLFGTIGEELRNIIDLWAFRNRMTRTVSNTGYVEFFYYLLKDVAPDLGDWKDGKGRSSQIPAMPLSRWLTRRWRQQGRWTFRLAQQVIRAAQIVCLLQFGRLRWIMHNLHSTRNDLDHAIPGQ